MRIQSIFFAAAMITALPAFAGKIYVVCSNASGARLSIEGVTSSTSNHHLGTLQYNPVVSNSLRAQGIENAFSLEGMVGETDWNKMTFSLTTPYGESAYLRQEDNGGRRFVLISQDYGKVANYLFNASECRVSQP